MAYSAIRALHNARLIQNLKTINFVVRNVIMRNGTVLFVNTDRDPLLWRVTQHFARRAGQPYVLHKWVGGTLTNFLATQRYYARKQHVSANFQSVPDLIFCSNVAENRRLFDEANTVMIPTVGIMHTQSRNHGFVRDPHVTYPLPTYAPKSLSTIYFCNKIISDVILHHRRKQATYALYSIPPASTSAASTLLSPMARSRLSTSGGPEQTDMPLVASGGQRMTLHLKNDDVYGSVGGRPVDSDASDPDADPDSDELVGSDTERELFSTDDVHLTPDGVAGSGRPPSSRRFAANAKATAHDEAVYRDALQEIVGEDVPRVDGPVRDAANDSIAQALARGRARARVAGGATLTADPASVAAAELKATGKGLDSPLRRRVVLPQPNGDALGQARTSVKSGYRSDDAAATADGIAPLSSRRQLWREMFPERAAAADDEEMAIQDDEHARQAAEIADGFQPPLPTALLQTAAAVQRAEMRGSRWPKHMNRFLAGEIDEMKDEINEMYDEMNESDDATATATDEPADKPADKPADEATDDAHEGQEAQEAQEAQAGQETKAQAKPSE